MGVVLAAGAGTRLRPLTLQRPKALCPVGAVALVDLAIDRLHSHVAETTVNIHHGRAQLEAHLAARPGVHLSIEEPVALGTAGALGSLRPWIDGRGVLVVNADAWSTADLGPFVEGWDGQRVRVLLVGSQPFGPSSQVVASLLPWTDVALLGPEPAGLYERCWRSAHVAGRLEAVAHHGPYFDCGTPASYLAANLRAAALAGGSIIGSGATVSGSVDRAVIGSGARVEGRVERSVVWDHAEVGPTEILHDAIRADYRLTVLVRDPHR